MSERQVSVIFRGCELPAGMTPTTAARTEAMLIGYIDGSPEFDGVFPLEFAVRLFEAFQEKRESKLSR